MAEMIPPGAAARPDTRKQIRVDFTPLVDLGFLLITFFVFTSALSAPAAMRLIMPDDRGPGTSWKASATLTVMPAANGNIYYYEGLPGAQAVKKCNGKTLREVILHEKERKGEKLLVRIAPLHAASYAALVNVLDEMTINGILRFAVADASPEELKALQLQDMQ